MNTSVVRFAGTWLIVIVASMALARTTWGRPLIYGLLWLAVVLLLVTHSQAIEQIFSNSALELNG